MARDLAQGAPGGSPPPARPAVEQRRAPWSPLEWVRRWGVRIFIAGLGLHLLTVAVWARAYTEQVDVLIYRMGGHALAAGLPLYQNGLNGGPGDLLFNYPPFAAILFLPLAPIPSTLLRVVLPFVNLALLMAVIHRCWRATGITETRDLRSLTLAATGILLWLEPVRTNLLLGQIGLVLLALIVFDLLPASGRSRWNGTLVGVAAGVKLTPLFFVPFLVMTRRTRAALVASGTFLLTVLVGWIVVPSQARIYWLHGTFHDLSRVAPVDSTGDQSLRGLLARLHSPLLSAEGTWVIAAGALAVCSLLVAAAAHRRGEPLLAIAICGLASAAVSPFAWGYHWVWFVPLAVFLGGRVVLRRSVWAGVCLVALWAATAAWITGWRDPATGQTPPAGLIGLEVGGWVALLTRNTYVLAFLAILAITACSLRRRPEATRPGQPPNASAESSPSR